MIWWLLLLYPLVGLYLAVYCLAMYSKYDPLEEPVSKLACFVIMLLLWPIYVWFVLPELWDAKKEALGKPARDLEALIERIRKEPDPLLADWDREFNELAGIEEEPKQWRVGNPAAAAEYDRNMVKARSRSEATGTRILAPSESIFWYPNEIIDDFRLCEAPQISQGGLVPTTAELNKDFPVRQFDVYDWDIRIGCRGDG